jgi:hypothetical protein
MSPLPSEASKFDASPDMQVAQFAVQQMTCSKTRNRAKNAGLSAARQLLANYR